MRFVRKGGVWKNTEDEILKAAVMKYGKNQWARVSSLLVRKSAKQCKARWHEWLDPSIKKTEWTRDEEEKLLHLAKIMPSQWRSIAAIVGRTSTQCLDHYTRLLDTAQAQAGGADASVAGMEDPRRLRPGEIDPHPETKPARPDPVDMDEDEKEMLSEARARLANTKGKKAKRKAREKQLEEARRLVALQKKRELKAAGIEFRTRAHVLNKNKRKQMDYNIEIPFERRAPAGFFDTGKEDERAMRIKETADAKFIGKTMMEITGKSRDQKEEEERAKDAKRQKLHRKHNLPQYIERVNALNDVAVKKERPKMVLPAPQVTDRDIQHLAAALSSSGSSIAPTPATARSVEPPTPALSSAISSIRTPRVPASQNSLMLEAQNLARLERAETPLKGGDNVELNDTTPQRQTPSAKSAVAMTPNPLLSQRGPTSTPMTATPLRDELRINEDGDFNAIDTPNERRALSKRANDRIRRGFANLPKPKNDYTLVMPVVEDEDAEEVEESVFVPDADDVRMWEERKLSKQREAAFRRLSSVLQRPELPRPESVSAKAFSQIDFRNDIDAQVHEEMLKLVRSDLIEHPLNGPPSKTLKKPLQQFSESQMTAARALVEAELERMGPSCDSDEDMQAFVEEFNDWMFIPAHKCFGRLSEANEQQRCHALRQELELLNSELEKVAKKADKAEKKASLLNGGYLKRALSQGTALTKLYRELGQQRQDLACFEALRVGEMHSVPSRIQALESELASTIAAEGHLQDEYYELRRRGEALQKALAAAS